MFWHRSCISDELLGFWGFKSDRGSNEAKQQQTRSKPSSESRQTYSMKKYSYVPVLTSLFVNVAVVSHENTCVDHISPQNKMKKKHNIGQKDDEADPNTVINSLSWFVKLIMRH